MSAQKPDYYLLLDVPRTASLDDIKRAYKQAALKYHPDRNPDDPAAEERFKAISEAFTVLSDPQQRKRYDLFGHRGVEGASAARPPDFQSLSELLEGLFGEFVGGLRRRVGRDIRYTLEVSFKEAALGANKPIDLKRPDGSTASYNVRVPAGVDDGAVRSIRGAGEPGPAGPGDLNVVIAIVPDPQFSRQGSTVHYTAELGFADVALGTNLNVPTLWGEVTMRIPPGTQAGAQLRLKGKGVPVFGGYGRGDQIVHVQIQVPTSLSERQRSLLEELREAFGDTESRARRNSLIDKLKAMLD